MSLTRVRFSSSSLQSLVIGTGAAATIYIGFYFYEKLWYARADEPPCMSSFYLPATVFRGHGSAEGSCRRLGVVLIMVCLAVAQTSRDS